MNKEYTNNLISEKSPYLLQHAHNPINWYAWSDDAFKLAKVENKPFFYLLGKCFLCRKNC